MSIERLRALEKAVDLVAKATRGPWAFMNEKFDDCMLAFGTDSLEYDAPLTAVPFGRNYPDR